jgi:gamma-glutamyltranspeptidase/glutathione hydrolase
VQPELARTLESLDDFYRGPVATAAPPPFTAADFAAHEARWVEPVRAPFAGVEVCELPPNSRGYLVLDAIRRMEPLDGLRPGDAEFHLRQIRALRAAIFGGDTVYLCVVDERGMAASVSQSLFLQFGSGVVVPGTGVLLHDRGAYHTAATYRGGARPVHTLAPGMALRAGRPALVFGTMGGDAQVQIHLQLLARILVAGEAAQDAVAAPRWTFDRTTLLVEAGLPSLEPLPAGLATLTMSLADLAGHAHAIRIHPDGLDAGADPRADGVAVGD